MRIRGIGEEYGDLLEMAGVDTVVELAQRNARTCIRNCWNKRREKTGAPRAGPEMVRYWIERAKSFQDSQLLSPGHPVAG